MTRPSIALLTVALMLVAGPAHAYRDLCLSVSAACEWSGPNVAVINADVCWSTATGVRAKGTAPCPPGSNPYHLKYGEVIDPTTGQIQAFAPLDDACAHGICFDGPPPGNTEAQAICCEFGICVPLNEVLCNGTESVAYYCDEGVTNLDGTVDCYSGEPI